MDFETFKQCTFLLIIRVIHGHFELKWIYHENMHVRYLYGSDWIMFCRVMALGQGHSYLSDTFSFRNYNNIAFIVYKIMDMLLKKNTEHEFIYYVFCQEILQTYREGNVFISCIIRHSWSGHHFELLLVTTRDLKPNCLSHLEGKISVYFSQGTCNFNVLNDYDIIMNLVSRRGEFS